MTNPENESEQKLKLSTSNIIALGSFLFVLTGGFTNIKYTQAEFNQRITTLEKEKDERRIDKDKLEYKLDELIKSVNQIKVDMAGQRVLDAEKNYEGTN